MKLKRVIFSSAIIVLALSFFSLPVLAADIVKPEAGQPNVTITQAYKNLYTAGANVTVNADVSGDLTAAGGMVLVVGKVEQEALLAGGTVELSGPVGGQARVTGGNITISSPLGGDLVVAGGNVNLTSQASVAGDLLAAGGNINIDSPVKGKIKAAGGTITINSKVDGSVDVKAGKLIFGPQAQVLGNINYSSQEAASVAQGAKLGQMNFTRETSKGFGLARLLTLVFLFKLLGWLVAGFVLLKFRKEFILGLVEDFKSKPWENLGYGLIAFVGIPVIAIILFFTVIGAYLGVILGLLYALLLVAGGVMAAIVLGYFLLSKLHKPHERIPDWQAVVIGVVVWAILTFIPILGWAVIAVVFLMVLGAGVKRLNLTKSK